MRNGMHVTAAFVLVGGCSAGYVGDRAPTGVGDFHDGDPGSGDFAGGDDGGTGDSTGGDDGGTGDSMVHGWVVAFEETFEGTTMPAPSWAVDTYPDSGYSDDGAFFQDRGVTPPVAYRATVALGESDWLTVETYSRSQATEMGSLFAVTNDPAGGPNHVLRLASVVHTDATIIRSTEPLPPRYRISLRVGYADFGDGLPGDNGYSGGETADPWLPGEDATVENGFYWLAVLDTVPRPHNNVFIHHHRKVVMDSDNNIPSWMQIYDGQHFIASGEKPLMMFGLDGTGSSSPWNGVPFYSYAGGAWQPSGSVRAVDSYKPLTWYRVEIERNGDTFTLTASGDFRFGGVQTYTAVLDAAARCVWHYNRQPLDPGSPCVDSNLDPDVPSEPPLWPEGSAWPDYFMFGDPHNNFYEGEVYYDDVRLEVWQ